METWNARHVRPDEFEPWSALFRGYAGFYDVATSDDHQRLIWSWIHDERSVECLVVAPTDADGVEIGPPVGLAHLREWVRPLRGVRCGYLDDLFVAPAHRGSGAVQALYAGIEQLGGERGWPMVRWTTADDNYRARRLYDQLATRTTWITYDMTLGGPVG